MAGSCSRGRQRRRNVVARTGWLDRRGVRQAKRAMTNPWQWWSPTRSIFRCVAFDHEIFCKSGLRSPGKWSRQSTRQTRLANADSISISGSFRSTRRSAPINLSFWPSLTCAAFDELNDTDLNSYQALVDVFQKEGVLQSGINVREKILKTTDFGS